MTATDKPAQARDDSIAYWVFAAIALVFAVLLGTQLVAHHMPFAWGLFALFGSFTSVYMGLGHLWAAWQRAKTVTSDSD